MLNRKMRIAGISLALSLAIMSFTTGCNILQKEPVETESETQTETQTESETETEEETESETELQTDVPYTSRDGSIRITLPDSTWKVTQDADEMRVFSSGSAAMINIVHAADATAMRNLSVQESEEELETSLRKQYPDTNAFEVVEFETLGTTALTTYEYVVKYNSTSMWAYSVTYAIVAADEAYVITGTVTEDNEALLNAVRDSVESFTVLTNTTFSALPGTVVNQSETTQSESAADAEGELQTLTDYGTSTTLYASDNVNIRLQPSTDAGILGSLAPGDQVTVVGETSSWFKVNVNGNVGYISKAFLVNTPTSQSETTADQTEAPVSDSTKTNAELNSYIDYGTGYQYYATTDVNLRAQPGTDSSIVGGLANGQAVTVIGETDNWFVVSVNGTTGYVSKSYISSSGSGNSGSSTGGSGNPGNSGSTGGGTASSGTGTVNGTILSTTPSTITIQGDDGNTYTINYSDASVSTNAGLQEGLYISATVDYSGTAPNGDLYATNVTGY